MPFSYPSYVHTRRHGPQGYQNYEYYKPWLRDEFTFRCVYCLVRERWYPDGQGSFSVDHFVPQSVAPNRANEYDNLVYACRRCNAFKQANEVLDPCSTLFSQHIQVREDGEIEALTNEGAIHISILQLDSPDMTEYRRQWLTTLKYLADQGDEEAVRLLHYYLGFPTNLPNLTRLRPPNGNTRPEGTRISYYQQRAMGILPATY